MATQPVAPGRTGPAMPMEVEGGVAPAAGSTGGAAAAGKAEARKAEGRRAGPARPATPGARSPGTLGKSVDKALGKVKPPRTSAPSARPAGSERARTGSGYATGASAATAATGEWAFLQDRGLSIEDKLFRFMMLVQKKNDAELVKKMEEYKSRFTASSSSSGASGSKGLSLFDALKGIPFVGAVAGLIGEAGVKRLVSQVSGPVLAALATAAGMPALAPVALRFGGDLAGLAFVDLGGRAATSGSGGAKASGDSPDERVAMFELQRLVEKQQAMFTAISNTLKCLHDTQMSAIHNIR